MANAVTIFPNGHVEYVMYKDGGALIGVAKVTMPSIKYKTSTVTGAGLMGDFTVPLAGMIEAMSVTIEFNSVTDAAIELGSNEWHDVALMVADQYFDRATRSEEIDAVRFELSIRPTETNAGTIAVASAADASGTYSVCRYVVYKNDEKVIEIDPLAQIHSVNGIDCAANIRKAIGLT